jgi:TonB family protein
MQKSTHVPPGARLIGLALFLAALVALTGSAAAQSSGILSGVIRDSTGVPVIAAEVRIDGTDRRALSSDGGAFRFTGLPPGEATLTVRRLGFSPASRNVTVLAGSEVRVDVRLTPVPTQLPTVAVRARREASDSRLAGFHSRLERGGGSFITRERLDQVTSYRFVDVLRELPGVRIVRNRGVTNIRMRGADCSPLVFIDGFPAAAGTFDFDMLDLFTVEAIEVYHGLASVPAEFSSARNLERCGVVAIWSRPYRPNARRERPAAPLDIEQLVADRVVFTAEDVDTPATLLEGAPSPVYPDSLWRTGTSGRVVVEFIVDVAGRMQINSFRVVSSTHPLFSASVQRSLEEARFVAAVWQGRNVRQLVHLPYSFEPPSQTDVSGPNNSIK